MSSDQFINPAQDHGLYQQAASLAGFGAWECDIASQSLTWTDEVYDIFGLPRGVPIERTAAVQMYHPECRRQMEWLREQAVSNGTGFSMDARIFNARGQLRWMRLSAKAVRVGGQAVTLFGSKQDITEDRLLLDRLREKATHDTLTGLPNREIFEAQCEAVARGQREDAAALVLVDIDNLRQINERQGREAGDEALRQLAGRLQRGFRDALLIARCGGDEIGLLLPAILSGADWSAALARRMPALSRPLPWNGAGIALNLSIGVAPINRQKPQSARRLFAEADAALYRAKAAGGGTVCHHSPLAGEVLIAPPAEEALAVQSR